MVRKEHELERRVCYWLCLVSLQEATRVVREEEEEDESRVAGLVAVVVADTEEDGNIMVVTMEAELEANSSITIHED